MHTWSAAACTCRPSAYNVLKLHMAAVGKCYEYTKPPVGSDAQLA